MKVALTFNLIHEDKVYDGPIDRIAEFDSEETIQAVREGIESGGHKVLLIEADEHATEKLYANKKNIDIVFNIAEGLNGEARESHIPATLDMLQIPYTGSGPLTLAPRPNRAAMFDCGIISTLLPMDGLSPGTVRLPFVITVTGTEAPAWNHDSPCALTWPTRLDPAA